MDSHEVELKLRVRPEDMARLRRTEMLSQGAGRAVTKLLETTYFDTADLALRKQAVTLRVRRQGRSFVQTVKAVPQLHGAVLSRGEWQSKVAGAAPDLGAVAKGEGRDRLEGLDADDLKPVFASHIRRTTRLLRPAGSTAHIE